ncbi:MAG TPA: DNA gyrase modulator, partial [Kribbella sp.]
MTGIQLTPQDTIERGLALAADGGADGCVVLVAETSSTNLRWANNTLTTNGAMRGSSVTVIATVGAGEGTAAGVVGRSSVTDDSLQEIVSAAIATARAAATAAETMSCRVESVTDDRLTTPAAVPSPAPTVAITVTSDPRIAP